MGEEQKTPRTAEPERLGLIAGAGQLPAQILHQLAKQGQRVLLARLGAEIVPPDASPFAPDAQSASALAATLEVQSYEELPQLTQWLGENGAGQVCLAGAVRKPTRSELLSSGLSKVFGELEISHHEDMVFRNDSALLDILKGYFSRHGISIVAPQDLVPNLLATTGTLGKHAPSARDLEDIGKAMALLARLTEADLGQGLVICDGLVLGVETARGTDTLLHQITATRAPDERGGVLVKCIRANQDFALDLPSLGPATVESAQAARLSGIAVQAGAAYLIERESIIARADEAGLFLQGVEDKP